MAENCLTILAIDDHEDNPTVLKAVVADAFPQARVLTALNGAKGIELAVASDPDVILLDIAMPDMDGFEVCRRLKADERTRHIPVVFLTALQTGRERRLRALETGAEAFLSMPFDEAELIAQIRAMAKLKAAHLSELQGKELLTGRVLERTRELERELAERKWAEDALRQAHAELTAINASVPVALLLVDSDRRVTKLNNAALQFAGSSEEEDVLGLRTGEVLHCIHSLDDPRGCGFGESCSSCKIRNAVLDTFAGKSGRDQVEALLPIGAGGGTEERCLLIATAYLESNGVGSVLISAQDITARKRAEEELRTSDQRYRLLFEHMLEGFAYCKMLYDDRNRPVDFMYLKVNDALEKLSGLRDVVGKRVSEVVPGIRESNPELLEIYGRVASGGAPEAFELDFKSLGRWLSISAYGVGPGHFVAVFEDITERKLDDADRETMLALLRLLNAPNDTRDLIRTITVLLQGWSGCEAVGIRLKDGDDYPYFETHGFPLEFVEAESNLCAWDANHELLRDNLGNPLLECMCGNVLSGRFDPKQQFFTPAGSFWTNSTTRLLASTTEADRQSHTRNRCNREGYESVALVPLRYSGRVLGLLQCNDPHPGRFTPRKIALLERAADSLAIALDQRRIQAALRASEEQYRLISESTADVTWLLDVASGKFTFVSPSVQRLLGYSAQEVLSKKLQDLLTPEDYRFFSGRIVQALAKARSGDDSERNQTNQMVQLRKDGSRVHTEVVSTLLWNQNGSGAEVLGVARDITARKSAEDALIVKGAQLLVAQRIAGLGSYSMDIPNDTWTSSTVLDEIFGIDEKFVRSTGGWASLISPGCRERMIRYFEDQVLGRHVRFDREYKIVRRNDGQERWVHGLGELEFDEEGRPIRLFGTILDITGRKHAEEQKAKLEAQYHQALKMESVGRLAGGVAHDFNNLLTVINGYSDLLLAKLNVNDPLRGSVEEVHKAGVRAAALTQQLLAFSRKQILQPRLLDLNAVVAGMRPMLARLVGEDVKLRVELHPDPVTICADPSQLEQVVMNLAVNSRDGMPNGGKLLIETAVVELSESDVRSLPRIAAGSYAVLTVTDSGVGMDEETRSHIFEPFFTTKEVGKGTGLGLSMIQGIVAQSGGCVVVLSEPGCGATFTIYLPKVEDAPIRVDAPESVPEVGGIETVLVVEDQAEVREYAAAALAEYGYHVILACDAGEALSLCERGSEGIDLVLTDVVMPNMSGKELADWLRRLCPEVKVLFMSGYTDDVIAQHGVLESDYQFIQKPFSPKQLAQKVRSVLGTRARRIVVADDEIAVRHFLGMALERDGYKVFEAADGKQALKLAIANSVDLVITDLVMPEQEGLETIQGLRREVPGVGIIAISGAYQGRFLAAARMLGADAVMGKPVDPESLLAKVREVLAVNR